VVAIALHCISLVAGAVALALLLHALHHVWAAPQALLSALSLLAAMIWVKRRTSTRLPGSPWQVPRSWGRLGHHAYSAVFGGILGFGILTSVPSVSLYVVLGWGLAAANWSEVWPVFVAFAVGRGLPLVVLAARARRLQEYPYTNNLENVSAGIVPIEMGLLAAACVISIPFAGLPTA